MKLTDTGGLLEIFCAKLLYIETENSGLLKILNAVKYKYLIRIFNFNSNKYRTTMSAKVFIFVAVILIVMIVRLINEQQKWFSSRTENPSQPNGYSI